MDFFTNKLNKQASGDTDAYLAMLNIVNQNNVEPDDYRENGILCCGKCGKSKERTVHMEADRYYAPMDVTICLPCQCVREKDKREREERDNKASESLKNREISWLRSDGLAGKYRDHRFDNDNGSQSEKIVATCKSYADTERFKVIRDNGYGLLLWGDVGTGKTWMAGCIANALIDQGVPVFMRTTTDILNMTFEARRLLLEGIRQYHLYILDDLGAERGTPFGAETIKAFVDAVYEAGRPMIVTTNLTAEELKNPFSPLEQRRTYDRIWEMCATRLLFEGESLRDGIARDKRKAAGKVLGV